MRLALGILVFAALGGTLCAHEGHAPLLTRGASLDHSTGTLRLTREAARILDVSASEVESRDLTPTSFAYATLTTPWGGRAYVSTPLSGRIVRLHARAGDVVEQGQVVAELDSRDVQQLRAEVLAAQNDVTLASKIVEQLAATAESGAVPLQRLVEARSKLSQDENALAVAKRRWESLHLSAARLETLLAGSDQDPLLLPMRAPIGGTVVHSDLAVGKTIAADEHLFEVVAPSIVWVRIDVLERDLARVKVGQPVELSLTSFPGKRWTTTVDALGSSLDPTTHLGEAWATLSSPSPDGVPFLPGMTGQVRLSAATGIKVLAVPSAAVLRDGAERYVLVETASTKAGFEFKKQSIVAGRRAGSFIEIRGGPLLPGDRVVTTGSHELSAFFGRGSLRLSAETAKDIDLVVTPAGPRAIAEIFESDGVVEVPPDRRAAVTSTLPGTVERVLVGRSQRVRAGDVLAEVRSLQLDALQLELLRAHLDLRLQTGVLANLRTAVGSVARRRLLEVENAVEAAKIRRDGATRQLETAGVSPSQIEALLAGGPLIASLPIRSPVDGLVVRLDKLLGQVVQAEEPLFEVHDLSQSLVRVYVAERDASRAATGQRARLRIVARPGAVYTGRIVRSGRILENSSNTLSVWIEFLSGPEEALLHNSLSRVSIISSETQVPVAVPRTAILREGSRTYVFVRRRDGTFERRQVITGRADDLHVEIITGLADGEPVAVRGVPQLQTGYAAIR